MEENLKDDFISTVSHELRTPLTSISGFSETMLKSWDVLSDEKKKDFLKIIKEQSQRLINLIENLLCVKNLSAINDTVVFKEVDILSSIKCVIEILKIKFPDHVFKLTSQKSLSFAFADYEKIQQVLVNIIENACKYSKKGTTVSVNIIEKGDFIHISIKDQGVGIVDTKKIFEKFCRLDNPLTREVQGSGLGLYITKNLIKKMGGEIEVFSDTNGSVFTIIIPISSPNKLANTKLKGGL